MLVIVTAMHCEAAPLIHSFGLKRDFSFTRFPLFTSRRVTLVESGLGKLKAAIATTHVLSHISEPVGAAVNIGIAGGSNESEMGELFAINQVRDISTGRKHHPDLLYRHNLKEKALETHDSPVCDRRLNECLKDMEASGFFEAASTFLPPHKTAALKIVSDHLDGNFPSKQETQNLVEQKLSDITDFLSLYITLQTTPENLSQQEAHEIIKSCLLLNLSSQQEEFLLRKLSESTKKPDILKLTASCLADSAKEDRFSLLLAGLSDAV